VAEIESCCQTNRSAARIPGKMVGITHRLLISISKIAFQGEKDVPSLPVPVEAIQVGIEGVIGRKLRNIGMVGFFVGAEIKANGPISGGGNVVKDELKSMPFGITPSVLIREFRPSSGLFFECKSRQEKADSGEGEGFLCRIFITKGVQDQRGSGKTGLDDGFQIRGKGELKGANKYPSEKDCSIKREESIHVLS
jgi:hypothetical protein